MGDETSFALDWPALAGMIVFLSVVYLLWRWLSGFREPHLNFSDLNSFKPAKNNWRVSLAFLPKTLMWIALISFALAFIDPHLFLPKQRQQFDQKQAQNKFISPVEGIAIYLVLDQSGSMAEEVTAYTPSGARRKMTKINLLKQVTKQFVLGDSALGLSGRTDDMIGLISFARGANVLSPLTLDHEAILKQLATFNVVGNKDQDGTAIGYAIFKAASLIAATKYYAQELIAKGEPAYTIKNSVIILITDGLQDPNPLDQGKRLRNIDIPGAAEYAKEQGVRLYIVNVEPKMALEEFAPNRRQMQRSAELTGGKFFLMDNTTNLEQIYAEINQLEKSQLPEQALEIIDKDQRPDLYRRISFYPYLIAFGLLSLLTAVILEATVLRRVP